jgi:hypothetical protein
MPIVEQKLCWLHHRSCESFCMAYREIEGSSPERPHGCLLLLSIQEATQKLTSIETVLRKSEEWKRINAADAKRAANSAIHPLPPIGKSTP